MKPISEAAGAGGAGRGALARLSLAGLLASLGSKRDIPAVGAAIHTERLLAAMERGAP